MNQSKKQLSVRIDKERLRKLRYIAKKEYRSVSGMVSILARNYIVEFEKQYGEIPEEENAEVEG